MNTRLFILVALLPMAATIYAQQTPQAIPSQAADPLAATEVPVAINLDASKIEQRGVKATVEGAGTNAVVKIASGHDQQWPGITIKAPGGKWDWARFEYFSIDVKNTGANALTVACRVDNEGSDGTQNGNTARFTLAPGQTSTLTVPFARKPTLTLAGGAKLFGMRGLPTGTGETSETGGTIDPSQVTQFLIFLPRPQEDHSFEVSRPRTGGLYKPPTLPQGEFFPFVDTFGQYIHRDWPGKVRSLEDLKSRVAQEDRELREKSGPADWNQWGGWKGGPQLQATGFFRTQKHGGKWWLVDPEGRLFFSHGVTGVRPGNSTPIDERETWFRDFPGTAPEFGKYFETVNHVVRGHYKGKTPVRAFNFTSANLHRKYGEDWREKYGSVAHRRLRSWGMNTIANWSDPAVYSLRRTAYVVAISWTSKLLEGSEGYWGQFRDVFDPEFRLKLREKMVAEKAAGRSAGDPWCLGYFVDNEISWGDDTSLAIATLRSPATQRAKQVLVDDLKAKYQTIAALNQAWNTSHQSWQALLEARTPPDARDAETRVDLLAFNRKTAETYFEGVRAEVKGAAPNQLYLGSRFAWVNPLVAEVATKYCDVVSYNLYRGGVRSFQTPGDVPLIIGEFHFGALDRGMFHTGLQKARSQEDRAARYKNYVTSVLEHPNFVGCHWFQYMDQPATGRALDEENYQIGFVDGADTPYTETVQAAREVGSAMYRVRMQSK